MSIVGELEEGEISDCDLADSSPLEAVEVAGAALQVPSCSMCGLDSPKYRCPGCELRSCSLACCKKHKVATGCDGSVKRSRMIPMAKFDNLAMLNDYRFLEEADRIRKRCFEERSENRASMVMRDHRAMARLSSECLRRGCKLQLLPPYFHRSQANTSKFDPIAETIFWKIEWIFKDAETLRIENERMPETIKISTLLKQMIHPRISSDFAQFSGKLVRYKSVALDVMKCFIKIENNGWTKDQRYLELDTNLSLKDNLRQKVIVEFPRIFVCLPDGSANEMKILTVEDKNAVMSKRIWERIPTAHTFDAKIRLMQEAAKSWQSPRDRKPQRPGDPQKKTAENSETAGDQSEITAKNPETASDQSDSTTLKPLRRLISNKRPRYNAEEGEKRRAAQKVEAENFKQQKIDAIKRLADKLSGNDQWQTKGGKFASHGLAPDGSAVSSNFAADHANFSGRENRVELCEITNSKPMDYTSGPIANKVLSKNAVAVSWSSENPPKSADSNRQGPIEIKNETDKSPTDSKIDQAPKRTVKTAFFGTLGDSDLSVTSDSDPDG